MKCPRTGQERECPCPLHDRGRKWPKRRKAPPGETDPLFDDVVRAYEDRFDGLAEEGE